MPNKAWKYTYIVYVEIFLKAQQFTPSKIINKMSTKEQTLKY